MKLRLLIILLFISFFSYAQNWPKIIGSYHHESAVNVFETYDKGYLIVGNYIEGGVESNGWLVKTDINGEIIWHKRIGLNDKFPVNNVFQDTDGNLYLIGNSYKEDLWGDAFIMKLNPCGEQLWCNIYNIPTDYEFGIDIKLLNNSIIAMIRYYGTDVENERVWLFKLNTYGDLIWQKLYCQEDPKVINEDTYEILITDSNNILLTGTCYYPDSGQTTPYWIRPYWIKIDSLGNETWELVWGINNNVYGLALSTIEMNGSFYSVGRHTEAEKKTSYDHPALFKLSNSGQQLYYADLNSTSEYGKAITIDILNDTTLVVGAGWCNDIDTCYVNCYLLDTLGNIIKQKNLIISQSTIRGADITFDNKIVMTGGFVIDGSNKDIYLWKMNDDLEFDSLYTGQYLYDSLCPYEIETDTIDCNCTIVNVDEVIQRANEELNSWVFPNPATDQFTVKFPDISLLNKNEIQQSSKINLEFFDRLGKPVYQTTCKLSAKEITINSSEWRDGLYLMRVSSENKTITEQKIIIQQ